MIQMKNINRKRREDSSQIPEQIKSFYIDLPCLSSLIDLSDYFLWFDII